MNHRMSDGAAWLPKPEMYGDDGDDDDYFYYRRIGGSSGRGAAEKKAGNIFSDVTPDTDTDEVRDGILNYQSIQQS